MSQYNENRVFCLEVVQETDIIYRYISGLYGEFVTRVDQWNFFADQRI